MNNRNLFVFNPVFYNLYGPQPGHMGAIMPLILHSIYVSTKGSDSNTGTIISPVRTIKYAQTLVGSKSANTQWAIVIDPGFYSETNLEIFPWINWYSTGAVLINDTSGSIILNDAAWNALAIGAEFSANGIQINGATTLSLIYTNDYSNNITINLQNFTTISGPFFQTNTPVGPSFAINLLDNVNLDANGIGTTIDGVLLKSYNSSISPGGTIAIDSTYNACTYYSVSDIGSGNFSLTSSASGNINFLSFAGAQCNISSANATTGTITISRDATTFQTLPSSTGAVTITDINPSSISIQEFSTSGTYTPNSQLVYAIAKIWGAGGGAGGAIGSVGGAGAASGGGGGAYAEVYIPASALTSPPTITIGAGGLGGDATGSAGSNGGDTSIEISGNGVTCTGGTAGFGGNGTTSAGSTIGTEGGFVSQPGSGLGTLVFSTEGGASSYGFWLAAGTLAAGGQGGASFGRGVAVTGISSSMGAVAGSDGFDTGCGGNGAIAINTASGAAGGNGIGGLIVIEEYLSY